MATTILKGVRIDGKEIDVDIYKFKMDDYKEILRLGIIALHNKGKVNVNDYRPKPKRSLKGSRQ